MLEYIKCRKSAFIITLWLNATKFADLILKELEKNGNVYYTKKITITFTQSTPDTPGQKDKHPVVIPIKTGIIDRSSGKELAESVLILTKGKQDFTFDLFILYFLII
jgi:hypothetical protein